MSEGEEEIISLSPSPVGSLDLYMPAPGGKNLPAPGGSRHTPATGSELSAAQVQLTAAQALFKDAQEKLKLVRMQHKAKNEEMKAKDAHARLQDATQRMKEREAAKMHEQELKKKRREEKVARKGEQQQAREAASQAANSAKADAKVGPAPGGSEIPAEAFAKAEACFPPLPDELLGLVFALEIFAGCARLSGAMAEQGLALFCPVDKEFGPWGDISDPLVAATILLAIDKGLIWYVHLATECKLWSCARTSAKSQCSVDVVWFTAEVLRRVQKCRAQGMAIYFSIENPFPSGLFDVTMVLELLTELSAIRVRYECCAWGATYAKASQLMTNLHALQELSKRCKESPT